MSGKPDKEKRVIGYTIDLRVGHYRYVNVEGVGECREHFMNMVGDIDKGKADVLMATGVELLFVDTSPMWMEKFIATVKQLFVMIADVASGKE